MDMDNASWAMDQLRAAAEENEKMFTSPSHTVASSAPSGKPNTVPAPTQYVSQFRIDGQPILPPLMTSERRCQMQQLRQRALELEAKYKQANTVRSTTTIDETVILESDSNSSTKSNSSSSSNNTNNSTMNTVHRFPQLQQTKTFIYDSTRQQPQESLSSPRSRPQTLHIEPKNVVNNVIPTICVNPPTPLRGDHQPPKPPPSPSPPKVHYGRMLVTPRRKLNSITNRIIHFERTGKGEQLQLEPQPVNLLWKNKELISVDKRMLRSSTSPSLNAAQLNGMQMQRSRSFTLEEPSQALVEHMRREGNKAPIPPPMPTTAGTSGMTLSSPRCRFAQSATVSSCSSAQSLAHLRRDTVESKAKQVQRSVSSSFEDFGKTTSPGRRCGGHTRSLQNQQQQLKQLLQQALHEADDVLDEQDQQERKQLTLAKRQMFKDIKSAHRDRFQQLVQYQHEEQRRMQAEFDRQQKFLIEQICADINVSAYAPLSSEPSPSGISEYTSTDDLPTPSRLPQNDTIILSPKESSSFTARKRLFDVDTESDAPSELLPIDYATSSPKSITNNISNNNSSNNNNNNNNNNNSSSNNNNVKGKIKKPVQRNYSKTPTARKATSPVLPAKTPPAGRRNINKTTATVAKSNPRNQPQQQSLSKTRRSASPSRQSRFAAKK